MILEYLKEVLTVEQHAQGITKGFSFSVKQKYPNKLFSSEDNAVMEQDTL